MQIRILTSIATPRASYSPGQVADIADDTAADWIARGMAARVEPEQVEAAVAPAYETAARTAAPKRRGR